MKTRLSRDIGYGKATSFYRHAVARLLKRLGKDPRWHTTLAVNALPSERYACWPRALNRIYQGSGNLGDRMGFIFCQLHPHPTVIIGTDSPQLEPRDIATAFRALGRHDVVIGPANDGGFWGIGWSQRQAAPDLFKDVRWSTEHSMADTLRSLPAAATVNMLSPHIDVDERADFVALRQQFGPFRYGPWNINKF
ncbi:MAG: DUF2064 domain-containing protein [Pseudomonadota bacterium]